MENLGVKTMKSRLSGVRSALTLLLFLGGLSGEPAQAQNITQSLRSGDYAAARAALDRQVGSRKDANLHRAHLEGMIALRQGNPAEAIRIFRAILDIAPGFEPARLQLVRALNAAGERDQALGEARRLALQTEDQRLRDQLLDQIALARGPKRGGVILRFSILPSSNITGGTTRETVLIGGVPFTLDPASRQANGIGINLGVTLWRQWNLGRETRGTASATIDRRVYDTALKPDETELGLRFDIAHRMPHGAVTFGPRYALLFQNGQESRSQIGIGISGTQVMSPRLRLTYSAEWLRQRFPDQSFRNGNRLSATFGLQWALSRDAFLSVEVPYLRETAAAPHLSHRDFGLGLGVNFRMKNGLALGAHAFAGRNRYDGIYPGFSVARADRVQSLRLSASHEAISIGTLVPEFTVTRKWQSSNIPLHDVTTTDLGLSLVRRF